MINDDNTRAIAEQYLDEMLAAEASMDYQSFVARFQKQDVANFGESRFKKAMYAIRH